MKLIFSSSDKYKRCGLYQLLDIKTTGKASFKEKIIRTDSKSKVNTLTYLHHTLLMKLIFKRESNFFSSLSLIHTDV